MELITNIPRNKLTKHTNSFRRNRGGNQTPEQTHITPKLTGKNDRNKLTKLTPDSKLTSYLDAPRHRIVEISNNIRYLFFSSEYVSLQYLKTCEEKTGSVYIQYRNDRRGTHFTHELTSPAGAV